MSYLHISSIKRMHMKLNNEQPQNTEQRKKKKTKKN